MAEIYFASDHHLDHDNILTFVSDIAGSPLVRPGFDDVNHMNEVLIARHNEVVGPEDKVYFLGDVGFGMKNLDTLLSRMNGKKRLILGNHDYGRKRDFEIYFKHFQKITESRNMDGILFTHRPVYLGNYESKIKVNVHGHIHEKNLPDSRYLNISVEQIDYRPISLTQIKNVFSRRGIEIAG